MSGSGRSVSGLVVLALRHGALGAASSVSRAFALLADVRNPLVRPERPRPGDDRDQRAGEIRADRLEHACANTTRRHGGRTPFEIGRRVEAPIVFYEAVARRWWIWRPCDMCGGVTLALRGRAIVDGSNCVPPALRTSIADHPCPGCDTRRQRLSPAVEAAVWYDTSLCDWVVRLPGDGPHNGSFMPLEIPWFDAPWSDVYRAASDLAFGREAFARRRRREPPRSER